jgi:Zn-dependent protease
MVPTGSGSFRLFRLAGIQVFLHWSWFLVAAYELSARKGAYGSSVWNFTEYLALFGIVLLHEFGHALACRQTGGMANQIVLWPFGGVAFVSPPQRPGAVLWSIAAGPLVNVLIAIALTGFLLVMGQVGWPPGTEDMREWLRAIWIINALLFCFNMLPVYPLDGGQMLRALLWFWLGRARSLYVASLVGFIGVAGLAVLAWQARSLWLGLLVAFIGMNCWNGWKQAQALLEWERAGGTPVA